MVFPINPIDELLNNLEVMKKNVDRLDEVIKQGFISERFGKYVEKLMILDDLLAGVKAFVEKGDIEEAISDLVEMRGHIDYVAGIYLSDKPPIRDKATGLLCVNQPDFSNIAKYKELFDFAQQRYEEGEEIIKGAVGAIL